MSIISLRSVSPPGTDCAEGQLAAAVILRALADAGIGETERSAHRPGGIEESEAIKFLTEPGGEWAASRRFWCSLAGIDADAFIERLTRNAHRRKEAEPRPLVQAAE